MKNRLGDKIRIQHILDAIQEIETYLSTADLPIFLENSMMRFACIKQMEIIGMRNVFAHEYFGIDSSLVWEIIKRDLPMLKSKIESILMSLEME